MRYTVLLLAIISLMPGVAIAENATEQPQALPRQPWIVVVRHGGGASSGRITGDIPQPYAHQSLDLPWSQGMRFDNVQFHLMLFSAAGEQQTVVLTTERAYQDLTHTKCVLAFLEAPTPAPAPDRIHDLMLAYHSPDFGVITTVLFVPAAAQVTLSGATMPLTGQTDAIQTWGQGTLTITLGKRPPITLTAYRPIVERSMGKMGMVHLDLNRKP